MHLKVILSETNGYIKEKIRKYFKEHGLPSPGIISGPIPWAYGNCYAVTCGFLVLKKYCVYCSEGEIVDVKFRGRGKKTVI